MKFDIARQPLVPAFLTLAALAVVAMWNAGGTAADTAALARPCRGNSRHGAECRRRTCGLFARGAAGAVPGGASRLGALDRRTADALYGHVRRTPHRTLQPLLRRNLPRHPALRGDRLRPRCRQRLSDGLRRIGPAGPRHEEFLPFILQRIRLRRHLPRLALHRVAAARRHGRSAAPGSAAVGRHAFPAHTARSHRRGRGPAAARPHALLRQLGRRRRIPRSGCGAGKRIRRPECPYRCSSRRPYRASSCWEPSSSST